MVEIGTSLSALPEGWIALPLSEVVDKLVDGSHNPPPKQHDGRPMLSARNIANNRIIFDEFRLISEESFQVENSRTQVSSGDVLLTIVGTIGRVAVVPENYESFTLQRSVAILSPNVTNSEFLMYQLQSPSIQGFFKENARGTAQKGIYLRALGQTKILIPPLNEQSRIVTKIEELFSRLDKGIEYLETAREQLKVYRQSVLKHTFEGKLTKQWREAHADQLETADQLLERIKQERKKLYQQQLNEWEEAVRVWKKNGKKSKKPSKHPMPKNIVHITEKELAELPILPDSWCWIKPEEVSSPDKYSIGIGPFGSNLKVSDYRESGIPLIFVKNITNNNFDLDLKYISEEKFLELQAHTVQPLDIVITKMGDPPGDVVIYPQERSVAVITADCLKFRLWSDFVEVKYFRYCIESSLIKKQLGVITKGVAQKKISTERFKTLCFPLPSRAEQREIVEELEKKLFSADELQSEIDRALARADILRQSILRNAFSGRLVPQDPNDEPASILLERIRMERQSAPKLTRKPSTSKKRLRKKEVVDLVSVLDSASDWLSAQDVFRECGISDGAETEVIEKLYLELRDLEKEDRIEIDRRGDEDWLRLRPTGRS